MLVLFGDECRLPAHRPGKSIKVSLDAGFEEAELADVCKIRAERLIKITS